MGNDEGGDVALAPTAAPPAAPRYQHVVRALAERIRSGAAPIGSLLPAEKELCAEFAVSRFTVREALRRLTEAGYVSRQQGQGTRVVAQEPRAGYVQSIRSLEGLFEYARDTRFTPDDVRRTVPRPEVAAMLGRSAGREWVQFDGVRRTKDGEPVCTTRIYLHSDFAALGDTFDGSQGALYRLVERHYQVTVEEVVQTLSAEPLPPEAAETLGCAAGSPGVRVMRRYLDADARPLLVTINLYASDRFSYTLTLKRESAPATD